MGRKRDFEIAFVGLKPGEHEFYYVLDDKFFLEKGAEDFSEPHATVKLTLEKNNGFMLLKFEIGGNASVTCDRCGNPLKLNLWDEFKLVIKLVDNPEEMNEFIKNLMDPFKDSLAAIEHDFDSYYDEYYDLYDIPKDDLSKSNKEFQLKKIWAGVMIQEVNFITN